MGGTTLKRPRKIILLTVLVPFAAVLTACGGKAATSSSSAAFSTAASSADSQSASSGSKDPSGSESTGADSTGTDQSPGGSDTSLSSEPVDGSNPSPSPTILGGNDINRPLTLRDVFQYTGEWKDDRYNLVNETGVTGIGETLSTCDENRPDILEFRLAQSFKNLSFKIGLANDSKDSNQIVSLRVIANGAQVDSQHVAFNVVQPLSYPVKGVNALQMLFVLDPVACQKAINGSPSVNVVLTGVTLT